MHSSLSETCYKLRSLLEVAVRRNLSEGILLSGGLDTSILAALASRYTTLQAFTVAFEGAQAPDVKYAQLVANRFSLKHFAKTFSKDELHAAILMVVKTLKSFDPMEIRNSVTICMGLKMAKEYGLGAIMTGDGCDELFAGYSFLFDFEKGQLDLELQKLWEEMQFSSVKLAKALGVETRLPYLDPDLKSFAIKLDSRYKIRKEKGMKWGKWILRKAFQEILPEEIVWRVKTPIEQGSGTAMLTTLFNEQIADEDFEYKKRKFLEKDLVLIRDKEHLFYYEVYRSVIGVPHPTDLKGKVCPYCNSNVAEKSTYCRTCGAYPI